MTLLPGLVPGLVSVTFRQLPPARVVSPAADAGLAGGRGRVPRSPTRWTRRWKLFAEVPALKPYWQPPAGSSAADATAAVLALEPVAAHVFSWDAGGTRLPLAARASLWRPVPARLAALPGTRHAMLEFVRDDSPAAFAEDAATLRDWLSGPGWGHDS